MKKKLLLIATGGTIASKSSGKGLSPSISPEELLNQLPEIPEECEIDTYSLLNIDSTNIQPEHWLLIAGTVEKDYPFYDGFVITHGTDTMAYTAAALSYLIQNADKPVILTGSQKPIIDTVTDAGKNLYDSFLFACHENVYGVYVVFSGQAILGTHAKKIKSKSFEAFNSINYPAAAFINGRHVIQYTPSQSPAEKVRFYHKLNPRVFVLKLIPGVNPDILDYIALHYDAVLIESYGVGGLPFASPRNFIDKLEHLKEQGCIVVVATQAIYEGSDMSVYEVGVRALQEYDVLQTYDMTVEAAVTKLMWILAEEEGGVRIKEIFYTPINNDIHTFF